MAMTARRRELAVPALWARDGAAELVAQAAGGDVAAVVDSAGRRPSSEWRIHRDIYQHRPEAAAVLHAHPPHATALAADKVVLPTPPLPVKSRTRVTKPTRCAL